MAADKIGQDLLNSLTGNLPKAVLFVRKYEEKLLVSNPRNVQQGLMEKIQVLMQNATSFHAQILTSDILSNSKAALGGNTAGSMSFESLKAKGEAQGFAALRVQYNPNSIYLDTSAGLREIDNSSISNMMNNQITQIHSPGITTLGTQLIFDDMDVMDAFMLDSSMMSTGAAMSAIGKATGIKKKKFTVKTEVEGLIACLLSPLTRTVVFTWGDMVFWGELFQVNANYTMFNKSGNPIRAVVEISIQQDTKMVDNAVDSYWNKAFDAAFGEAGKNVASGGKSMLNKVTNNALLNLNI